MKENAIYFGKNKFYNLIRNIGGIWNDSKERPIVCLIRSIESEHLYWAIPIGNYNHRDEKAKTRMHSFLQKNNKDIRSCYYHIGNTDEKTIFFISDVVPIIDKYIEREYLTYGSSLYIIQNKQLISELNRKLKRILAFEKSKNNYFRQHITDLKMCLLEELENDNELYQEVALAEE